MITTVSEKQESTRWQLNYSISVKISAARFYGRRTPVYKTYEQKIAKF